MRQHQIIGTDGKAAGTFLHDTMGTEAGRLTVVYVLTRLGLFEKSNSESEMIVRNAAIDLLNDIRTQTGFALDINLIH